MIELVRAVAELQMFCEERRWRFCFIGGLAVQMWSELRATMDVGMTLLTGLGEERPFIDARVGAYAARIPNVVEHAELHRVLLLKTPEGLGLDIAMGGLRNSPSSGRASWR